MDIDRRRILSKEFRPAPLWPVPRAHLPTSSAVLPLLPWHRSAAHRWLDMAVAQLGPTEFRRRLWHFAPGILALCSALLSRELSVGLFLRATAIAATSLGLVVVAFFCQTSIRRPAERNCRAAILGYVIPVMLLLVVSPMHSELALAVAGIVAFGDGSAALVGRLAGHVKLPWNSDKSWAGSAAFIFIALPLAASIYWAAAASSIPILTVLLCVVPTVIAAALAESLPSKMNDNLIVGTSAATMLIAMQWLVTGSF